MAKLLSASVRFCLSVSGYFQELFIKCKDQNCFVHFPIVQRSKRGLLITVVLNDRYETMVANRQLLVYSFLRKQLGSFLTTNIAQPFYSMYLGYKEKNCIINFLIMQHTNRGLLNAMAFNDCFEAVRRHPLVYSLLIKYLISFYSKYLEEGSQHPSKEQS